MLSFCQHYQEIVVYGTGYVANRTSCLLAKAGINISCYVVSEKAYLPQSKHFHDISVLSLTDWLKLQKKDVGILVAVSEKYCNEVSDMLSQYGVKDNLFFVNELDLKELCRKLTPVHPATFLSTTKPISRLFGIERGTPIDRYYIDNFLRLTTVDLQTCLWSLEVAEDTYCKKFLPNAKHDILSYDKGMDLTDSSTLPEEKYDVFICTQVFHVIYNVKLAIKGAYRLIKHGGTLLATVAGNISQIAEYDMNQWGYYWGFTGIAIQRLMEEIFGPGNVEVFPYGNVMAATAFIQGVAVEDLPDMTLLDEVDSAYSICIGIRAIKC